MTEEKEEFTDKKKIRCSHCGYAALAFNYDLHGKVSKDVYCHACGKEFHVWSSITVTWTSPPMVKKGTP